ncbi:hypothetical protein ACFLXC_01655 [Chloroflexota bacterium]
MEITIVNLILAAIVLILGIWAYVKKKAGSALLVGIAFGLFAISHLLTLLGLAGTLNTLLVVIRILGYLVTIFAVYRIGIQK